MRSLRVALFLAVRSVIRGNYSLLGMSILIMALIYINLLFIPSLLQGATTRVNSQFVNVYTSDLVATPKNDTGKFRDLDSLLPKIRAVSGVQAATGVYTAGNVISYKDESGNWQVLAIDPDSFRQVFQNHLSQGAFLPPNSTDGILLGVDVAGNGLHDQNRYANTLKTVPVGATVHATLGLGTEVPLQVKGIIDNQFQIADLRAFITYKTLDRVVPHADKQATTVYIKTSPGANTDTVINRLNKLHEGLKLLKPDSVPGSIKEQVDTITTINRILSVISLFVAAITVFIVTFVDLVNRRRVLGIERAIGITPTALVLCYCFRAFLYTLLGIAFGAFLYRFGLIPYSKQHPFVFPNGPVSLVDQPTFILEYTYILMAVAIVAAWLPSWRSVKVNILDAIWG